MSFIKNQEPKQMRTRNIFGQSLVFLAAMLGRRVQAAANKPEAESQEGEPKQEHRCRRARHSGDASGAFNSCIASKAVRQARKMRRMMRVNGRKITSRKRQREGGGKFYNEFILSDL